MAKVLLPLICFNPLLLENGKRYDKKAFYQPRAVLRLVLGGGEVQVFLVTRVAYL